MNRTALAIGGATVAVAMIVLWVVLASGSSSQRSTSSGAGPGTAHAVPVDPGGGGTVTGGNNAPHLPDPGTGPALPATGSGENPRDYVVGEIRVHDHRSGDNKPLDVPPTVHPAESHDIKSSLTAEISKGLKQAMADCTKSLPKDARGARPQLVGQILIAIKDHIATVTKATLQLRDVTGDAADSTRTCIERKSVGQSTPAPDEPDLTDYSINITFTLM